MDIRTILVAEDIESDVLLLKHAFARAGSRAALQFVPDGEVALDYLKARGEYSKRSQFPFPSLMLLDLKLPKKNGLEVVQAIRADPVLKRLIVVVLTSSDQKRDVDLAFELGANSYLVKPPRLENLITVLQRVEEYWLNLNQSNPHREAVFSSSSTSAGNAAGH